MNSAPMEITINSSDMRVEGNDAYLRSSFAEKVEFLDSCIQALTSEMSAQEVRDYEAGEAG